MPRTAAPELKPNDRCFCASGRKFKVCHQRSTEPIRPGTQTPRRPVPDHIALPPYILAGRVDKQPESAVKSAGVLERMRRTSAAAADVLVEVGRHVAPGVTTDELDAICHDLCVAAGGYPSPLGYGGPDNPFPKSICTSVNEVVCHGIPDDRALRDGDIINLDVTLYREGVHGDTNATWTVGTVDPTSERLVRTTRQCLADAIAAVRPGLTLDVIGEAIEDCAHAEGFDVVREFVGHGIGEQFHTPLAVPHYPTGSRILLEPGMVFTIEPMITVGSWRTRMWPDGWTAVTEDRRRTAQFEHTVRVTEDGCEILTLPSAHNVADHPYFRD